MGKPQPFEMTLTCDYSFAPGAEWYAFIGIRPTKDGFSVWASGSSNYDSSRYNERIAHVKQQPIGWREVCRILLDSDTGAIYGDFEDSISVEGTTGWQEDMLARCWMKEDRVPHEVKEFIVGLDDKEIEWLVPVLGGDLFAESSVGFLTEYIEMESRSPSEVWEEIGENDSPNPVRILEHLEKIQAEQQSKRQHKQEIRLAPFKTAMDRMYDEAVCRWGKATSWASGIGLGARKRKLRALLVQFVETNHRLPDSEELKRMVSEAQDANPFAQY